MADITPNPDFTREVIANGGETLNLCYQCGTCTGSCLSSRMTAFKTRKAVRMAQLGMKDQVLSSKDLWYCTTCYTCYERCPRGVDIPGVLFAMRNLAVQAGHMAEGHKRTSEAIITYGHAVRPSDKNTELRKALGLVETPPTVLVHESGLMDIKRIMCKTGFDKLIGKPIDLGAGAVLK